MYEMSGSRVFRSGVGTQITAASERRIDSNPVEACSRLPSISSRRSASDTSCTCETPRLMPAIFAASVSIP